MAGSDPGVRVFEGALTAKGLSFAIVVGRFNAFITERLLEGAIDTLVRSGANADDIEVYRAPGSYELPQVAQCVLTERGRSFDALIALGCLIRGDTIHFDLIAQMVTKGLADVAASTRTPVAFGVLTTDSVEQAIHRAGTKAGNKGAEAALAAIEQANLFAAIAAAGASGTSSR